MVRRSEAEPLSGYDHHHSQLAKPIDMVLLLTPSTITNYSNSDYEPKRTRTIT